MEEEEKVVVSENCRGRRGKRKWGGESRSPNHLLSSFIAFLLGREKATLKVSLLACPLFRPSNSLLVCMPVDKLGKWRFRAILVMGWSVYLR